MKKELVLRSLGQTGIMITPVGLGCWQFSRQNNFVGKFWPAMEGDMINTGATKEKPRKRKYRGHGFQAIG